MLQTGSLGKVLPLSDFTFSEFITLNGLSGRAGKRVLSARYKCVALVCRRRSARPRWRSAGGGLSLRCVPLRVMIHGWPTSAPERPDSSVPVPPSSERHGPALRRGACAPANPVGHRLRAAWRGGFLCLLFSFS